MANTSIGFAGSAVAALEAGFAPRPDVYVGGTSLVKNLRQIKAGTSYDAPLFPPTSEDLPALYGAPVTSHPQSQQAPATSTARPESRKAAREVRQ